MEEARPGQLKGEGTVLTGIRQRQHTVSERQRISATHSTLPTLPTHQCPPHAAPHHVKGRDKNKVPTYSRLAGLLGRHPNTEIGLSARANPARLERLLRHWSSPTVTCHHSEHNLLVPSSHLLLQMRQSNNNQSRHVVSEHRRSPSPQANQAVCVYVQV